MKTAAVSDSSPLIPLEQIGKLDLLAMLFDEVLIPDEVARAPKEPAFLVY